MNHVRKAVVYQGEAEGRALGADVQQLQNCLRCRCQYEHHEVLARGFVGVFYGPYAGA